MAIEPSERVYFDTFYEKMFTGPTHLQVVERPYGEQTRLSTLPAFLKHLPDITNKRGLEIGCGTGWLITLLEGKGANMFGVDISTNGLHIAQEKCQRKGVEPRLVTGSVDQLPFSNCSFDFLVGFAILHHLPDKLDIASKEIRRVLKPGRKAIFCEPFGENPIIELIRRELPYSYKERTSNEKPFTYGDIEKFGKGFSYIQIYNISLLQAVDRVLPIPFLSQELGKIDEKILEAFPSLNRFCRYVILKCTV